MIWVVVVPGARTPPGHQEASDEPNDEGAHHRGGYSHRKLLGRVVGPVDGSQTRNQRKAAAAAAAAAVVVVVVVVAVVVG